MNKIFLIIFTLAIAILTPFTLKEAYKQRGYFAIGGKYVLNFLVPLSITLLYDRGENE